METELDAWGARVIAGSGRSGTTWLQDSLARANSLRTIFEPLHPGGMPAAPPYANRYLRPDQEAVELREWMNQVLSGRDRSLWPNCRVRPDRIRFSRSLLELVGIGRTLLVQYAQYLRHRKDPTLTKFIRANLLLGWLSRQLSARIVLLLRHPGGVVASKMKAVPAAWDDPTELLRRYLSDPTLTADHLDECSEIAGESLSPVEVHTALWCIENAVPLRQARECGIAVVHYERLLAHDDREWQIVLDHLGLEHRPDPESLARPSQQVAEAMKRRIFTETHVSRWMESLGDTERRQIDAMLDRFGVRAYNASDPFPADGQSGARP